MNKKTKRKDPLGIVLCMLLLAVAVLLVIYLVKSKAPKTPETSTLPAISDQTTTAPKDSGTEAPPQTQPSGEPQTVPSQEPTTTEPAPEDESW